MSVLMPISEGKAFVELSRLRTTFYECLSARSDNASSATPRPLRSSPADHPRPALLLRSRAPPDRTSWAQILDVVRLAPTDDAATVTADQLRTVAERLIAAGQCQPGDRDVLIVMDAGYDVMRLAWLLRGLPVELVGRLRSDRNLRLPFRTARRRTRLGRAPPAA